VPVALTQEVESSPAERRWHTRHSNQEDHPHDRDRRLLGQGSRHARAHDHRVL